MEELEPRLLGSTCNPDELTVTQQEEVVHTNYRKVSLRENQCWASAGSACFLGRQDPDPLVRGTDPDPAFPFMKYRLKISILTQNFSKKLFFRPEDNVPAGKL
jgi:hypothetical protein